MRKPSFPDLIYQRTFPKPKQGDPVSFYAHVQRYIVGEVRLEVQGFYGALDTLEAQYPGLDYAFAPHRRRLSRFPWHRRLFRVFDELGLTNDEILNLCQWEGTRAAKERYEREAGVQVRTTTGDDVTAAPTGNGPRAVFEDLSRPPAAELASSGNDTLVGTPDQVDKESKIVDGPSLLTILQNTMQSRMQGHSRPVHQAWEQWLKEALDQHGEHDIHSVITAIRTLEPETFAAPPRSIMEEAESISRSPTPDSTADGFSETDPIDEDQMSLGRAVSIIRQHHRAHAEAAR
jgi:hypothetical protein